MALGDLNLGEPNFFDRYVQHAKTVQDMQRQNVNPYQGEGLLNQLGAQQNTAGLGAQTSALDMYRQQALGLRPSVAGIQGQQAQMMAARGAAQAGGMARGGNVAGAGSQAISAGLGMQGQIGQQAAGQRAAEQQQAMAGYGGLGSQMVGQSQAYDQLKLQLAMAGNQQTLDWYLGVRKLQQQQNQFAQDRIRELFNRAAGAGGGAAGATSQMIGRGGNGA